MVGTLGRTNRLYLNDGAGHFGFDPAESVSAADLLAQGLTSLADLAHEELVAVVDFVDPAFTAQDYIDAGLVTAQELYDGGLISAIDALTESVNVHELVNSGLASLEGLINDAFLQAADLLPSDINLGALLASGLVAVGDLLATDLTNRVFDISADQDATTSIAVRALAIGPDVDGDGIADAVDVPADVNGDGATDVIVGNSAPSIGAAGSITSVEIRPETWAYVDGGAQVATDHSLFVNADDEANTVVIVGAAASGDLASIGLSLGRSNIVRDVRAYVGAADVAAGLGTGLTDPQGVFIVAAAHDNLLGYAAGEAGAEDAAVAASAVLNQMDSTTQAFIGEGADVRALNSGASVNLSVRVHAEHQTDTFGMAGSFAGAGSVGIGAALDAELLTKKVFAYVGPSASVNVRNDLVVEAISREMIDSVIGGIAGAFDLGIAGSVALAKLTKQTYAYIDGANAVADGNVLLWADSDSTFHSLTGAAGFGVLFGVGISAGVFIKNDDTRAFIRGEADITANGSRDAAEVFTGERSLGGNRVTRMIHGLSLTATSREVLRPLAVGGALAGGAGIAGSATVADLTKSTWAYIEASALVHAGAAMDQLVHLLAWDETNIVGLAGALSGAFLLGIGGGANLGSIGKDTRAYITGGADVSANQDVEIRALSDQDITSVSGTIAAGLAVGVAGAAGLFELIVKTNAYIGDSAHVRAGDSVLVLADSQTEIDIIAGGLALGLGAGLGVSGGLASFENETYAFIAGAGVVDADGNGSGIAAPTGDFDINFVADFPDVDEVSAPPVTNPSADDPSLGSQRG
ncbi:MAG TPA: hypothetical protein VIG92_00610, partial [Rhodospirillales bacterium]